MENPEYDVVVIGAGPNGIVVARFYMDIHPTCRLAILEQDTVVGGVWSSARQYECFRSESGLRMTGFSDNPLKLPEDAEKYHDTFESKYVTKYLEEYVDNHVYNGQSLRDRIIFGYQVRSVEKIGGVWNLRGSASDAKIIRTSKLVVASGYNNIPHMPIFPNQNQFRMPIMHQKEFGKISKTALGSDSPYTSVTVIGGGKSAADMVYDCVKAGKKVNWIVRQTREGPAAFAGAQGRGQYRNGTEMSATRFFAGLSPSCFTPTSWWTRAIHQSSIGNHLTTKIWKGADKTAADLANFDTREGALPGFGSLKPDTEIFWCNGPIGLIHHDDFWDTVAKNVHAYRSDVQTLEANVVVLEDGSKVHSDIVFCGTGWVHKYPFLTEKQVVEFGLPHLPKDDPEPEAKMWASPLEIADQQVVAEFPKLGNPPDHFQKASASTPSRLYNGIAPLNDDSIVFVGHVVLSNAFRAAEAQAIWVTAYFDHNVKLPSNEQAIKEVAYANAFSKRQYPAHGATGNYFHLDLVGYTDKLMADVGLTSHKQKGWLGNFMDPCIASDFKDMKDEYRQKYGYSD
ncbi:putative dimethylaniline monooxygenase [Sclerotinia borealis F-4128]|uniref:Putative dimethylaniline monooxygenase n=1 Tax=Sclerotinia borealis (strain F-4128) TaxID=1432307 RepID=W9CP41_SCLBF|nr:putative dimethylaniline monooxygenase [Sclerotinia borealis F-4128]